MLAAVTRLRERQASNPSDFLWRQTPPLLKRSRAALAGYLHCRAADLLLIPNVTHAINLVAASLTLPRGSEVLTTDHEYGAMWYCWQRWACARGWKLRKVKLPYTTEDPAEIIAAVRQALRPATRLLFFSHVTSTTGLVIPAAQLCALARRHRILSVIDGAHAVGMVPVDLARIGADFYGANCHKWLMAPLGCGFLHAPPKYHGLLEPLVTSWGWVSKDWQFNLEFHGCTDRTPQMVIPEVLAFRRRLGGESAIRQRAQALSDYTRDRLTACGLKPVTPFNPQLRGALVAFELPKNHPLAKKNWLWDRYRIECPVTAAVGKKFLRVSTAWFNSVAEIDRLASVLRP